ncbi:hypothetical protein Athai_51860 [Actinocatenispora thailandica]|uniref:Clp R domain-containing protein n=1 Tax=Actinocatenispora thailandica TaxID=227318 RepID=A0A7R7HZ03_9ACTN|nr:ATP-dependent Clp protease ATP-binding subunit [Actinocatenispora thailandica]BCJ37683.1 hypothetical protein Athai_51860 [Actinocatenispora thailandica]
MAEEIVSLGALIDQVNSTTEDPVERLASAARRAGDLSALGDQLIGHFVDTARVSGVSWAQIGQALGGVSKQAAQKRFSPDFSRFTARARHVMVGSEAIAVEHRHSYMGTEHILIALCGDPDSLAAKALDALGGPLAEIRDAATAALGPASPVQGKPRFTAKANAALSAALSEALNLNHNYIGTEHLLLGLLAGDQSDQDGSVAARLLAERDITYPAVRDNIVEQLSGYLRAQGK